MSESGPRLHVLVERAGQVVYRGTHDRFPIVLGRSTEATVQLPYQFISRAHASINVEGSVARVRDMGSRYKIENDRGVCDELTIDGRGQFRIADLEINLRVEKQLSDDPERTQAAAAPTRTFQRPTPSLPEDVENDRRGNDRRAGQSRRAPLQKSADQVMAPRPVPSAPAADGTEVVRTVAEDAMENNDKPAPLKPLFQGELGKFEWVLDPEIVNIQSSADVAVQGAVSWGPHIFDIRNFIVGDKINVSPRLTDEISLPALARTVKLGKFEPRGAVFNLPKDLSWSLRRTGAVVDEKTLRDEGRLKDAKNHLSLMLQKEEILTLNFATDLKSHFRYIKKPMPFFPRTWIENKEHFKKAIQASIFVHLVFSAIALLSVPEVKSPDVENVPKRFAKLLVETPKPVLAEPPPPPPEPPPPEPPPPPPPEPIIAEPPPPPPKPEPVKPPKPKEKPKPVKAEDKPIEKVVPVAEKPKPVPPKPAPPKPPEPPAPVAKAQAPPVDAPKDLPKSEAPPVKGAVAPTPAPPAPSPAQVEAEALQKMFNTMPNPGATAAKLPDNVKLVKTGGQAAPGIKVGGIANQVPTAGGAVVSGLGSKPSALSEAGQAGYAATSGGKAGSRRIGGVVADAPKFSGAMQGLSMAELMAVVNKYLAEIQRCYERSLVENSGLVGRVEYEWEISSSGGVTSASVKRTEMAGAEQLNGCVMGVIRSMKFPASKNGLDTIASVGFPFGRQ